MRTVKINPLWRRKWQPTPVFLPGESHGWRGLSGYIPWGHRGSDTTERLHFHFAGNIYSANRKKKINPLSNFQVCIMVLTIVTMLYITSQWLYNWKIVPLTPFTHFTLTLSPNSGNHLPVLCEFYFFPVVLECIYKWGHMAFVFLWHFTQHNILKLQMARFPLGWTVLHTHIFFIHLYVDGHLGCFHVLVIVSNAAVNRGVQVSLSYRYFCSFG